MARLLRSCCLLLLGLAATCVAQEFPVDQVVPSVVTRAHTDQQYALYLPPGYDGRRRLPLLVMLDPRGRAERIALAVDGARRHGWIVMASFQSRSDTLESTTVNALQALLDDADQRFAVDGQRLYLAGMSGTAKTLWTVQPALRGRLAGMIGCAGGRDAALPAPAADTPPFFGCSGDHDFNHREMLALDAALAAAGAPHRLQRFDGGHGWPPSLSPAIEWLELAGMRSGEVPRDATWIAAQFAAGRAAGEAEPDDYRRWLALAPLLEDFRGLLPDDGLAARVRALAQDPAVQEARKRETELAEDEQRYQAAVNAWAGRMRARFPDGRAMDPPPRGESLNALKVRTLLKQARSADAASAASAQRRLELAWVAAAFYLPTEARARHENAQADAALAVASAIFPDRTPPPP